MWNLASTDMESESTAWNPESKTLLESEYPKKTIASGSDQLNLTSHLSTLGEHESEESECEESENEESLEPIKLEEDEDVSKASLTNDAEYQQRYSALHFFRISYVTNLKKNCWLERPAPPYHG
ncbi:hypothetical protein P5673_002203 [Acropora cervicornis]|uniref:Uncharacterized protein n=1 Tax=Acropora cervicornis TaxID=6130 RepID=A0AAD9VGL6_ACRCE|nr:hypothetical protein P5673_002203 [Acropora cervicornis]